MKQLTRGDVAEDDAIRCVRQHERQRRGLDDGIEHQLALMQIQSLATEDRAEGVVSGHELAQLVIRAARDGQAEVVILQAGDAIA